MCSSNPCKSTWVPPTYMGGPKALSELHQTTDVAGFPPIRIREMLTIVAGYARNLERVVDASTSLAKEKADQHPGLEHWMHPVGKRIRFLYPRSSQHEGNGHQYRHHAFH